MQVNTTGWQAKKGREVCSYNCPERKNNEKYKILDEATDVRLCALCIGMLLRWCQFRVINCRLCVICVVLFVCVLGSYGVDASFIFV